MRAVRCGVRVSLAAPKSNQRFIAVILLSASSRTHLLASLVRAIQYRGPRSCRLHQWHTICPLPLWLQQLPNADPRDRTRC